MRISLSSLTALIGAAAVAGCASAPQPQATQNPAPAASRTASAPAPSAPKSPSSPKAPGAAPYVAASSGVMLCPKMSISNAPRIDKDGNVIGGPNILLNGVSLMIAPATNVCLSSGYGPRSGRSHHGVDYHTRSNGDVVAAGDGAIVEAVTRSDFGNMIVIDHGRGVFTRYAHLASFSSFVKAGAKVRRGDRLAPIGATGATSVLHLHYEILSGNYVSGVGSFGLTTHDPFGLPSAKVAQGGEFGGAAFAP